MKKTQTTAIFFFLFLLFCIEKFIFCRNISKKTQFMLLHLYCSFSHLAGYWKCSKRRTSTQNTWQQTRYFNIDFDSNELLFLFYISEKYLKLKKKQKHLFGRIFGSPHTSNLIYILRNCFSYYAYLKDMYMTLKGIGKILFASVLRILLICKSLNFTVVFTKK